MCVWGGGGGGSIYKKKGILNGVVECNKTDLCLQLLNFVCEFVGKNTS